MLYEVITCSMLNLGRATPSLSHSDVFFKSLRFNASIYFSPFILSKLSQTPSIYITPNALSYSPYPGLQFFSSPHKCLPWSGLIYPSKPLSWYAFKTSYISTFPSFPLWETSIKSPFSYTFTFLM